MVTTEKTTEYRLFGLSEEAVRRRLEQAPSVLSAMELLHEEEQTVLTLPAFEAGQEEENRQALEWLDTRFGVYVYSREGQSLPQRVVELLAKHKLTLSTAESCTGGMVAQQLTGVAGCSQVFGTGVVSYSNDCKQELLKVREDTLAAHGAVSARTAEEMACGVRRQSGAALGVSVTGEAGPVPSEEHPVGTVFIALADAKRTWVKELHLDAPLRDRDGIRRVAAAHALDLVRRYLEAYPAVMAGGQLHRRTGAAGEVPPFSGSRIRQSLIRLLPWRGDSRRHLVMKAAAWLGVLAVLVGGVLTGYRYLREPDNNRQLQSGLGEMYWNDTQDLTEENASTVGSYPQGMMVQFRSLYDHNEDIGGWIHIPDTAIDYPIMNYRNGYYESHNFLDQYSLYGQPYFGKDTLISPLGADRTMTIYGKNTGDGQMFSDLLSYRRIAYLREHPLVEMNTLYATGRWEIFAVLVVDERNKAEFDYSRAVFVDDEEYEDYIKDMRRRSLFHADSTVTTADRLLLLSVEAQQVYGFAGARLVVAARLITEESPVTYRANNNPRLPAAMTNQRRTTTTTAKPTTHIVDEDATTSASIPDLSTQPNGESTTATTDVGEESTTPDPSDTTDEGDFDPSATTGTGTTDPSATIGTGTIDPSATTTEGDFNPSATTGEDSDPSGSAGEGDSDPSTTTGTETTDPSAAITEGDGSDSSMTIGKTTSKSSVTIGTDPSATMSTNVTDPSATIDGTASDPTATASTMTGNNGGDDGNEGEGLTTSDTAGTSNGEASDAQGDATTENTLYPEKSTTCTEAEEDADIRN